MDLTNSGDSTQKTNASPKKISLIVLLILAALGGFASIALLLPQSAGLLKSLHSNFLAAKNDLPEAPSFRIGKKEMKLTFQGTMTGEKGAIALINDEMVGIGAEIEGVRVVDIQNHTLTIEYQGEKIPLTVGESFPPQTD